MLLPCASWTATTGALGNATPVRGARGRLSDEDGAAGGLARTSCTFALREGSPVEENCSG